MPVATRLILGFKRALTSRVTVWLATGGLLAYAFGIAVVNRARHMYAPTRPLALEDTRTHALPFNELLAATDARVEALFGHGWYGLEPGGVRWSAGLSSVLALPAQDVETNLTLSLRLVAAWDGDHSQNSTRIFCNGNELDPLNVKMKAPDDYSIHVPASVHQGYPIIVTLNYEFTVQPSGNDQRDVAVRLLALMLEEDADNATPR